MSLIYEQGLKSWGYSVFRNVFCFHALFDRADAADSHQLAAVMVGVYFLVVVIYAERHQEEPVFPGRVR